MSIKLSRITPLYETTDADEPRIWLQKGTEVHMISELQLHKGKAFAQTPGGFALISGDVQIPKYAMKCVKPIQPRSNPAEVGDDLKTLK